MLDVLHTGKDAFNDNAGRGLNLDAVEANGGIKSNRHANSVNWVSSGRLDARCSQGTFPRELKSSTRANDVDDIGHIDRGGCRRGDG